MNVWTKDYPKEPGYYWIKRSNGAKQIVYLSKHDLVRQIGTRDSLSPHYDIQKWGSKIAEPDG
jgi:hypothetical protein